MNDEEFKKRLLRILGEVTLLMWIGIATAMLVANNTCALLSR
jgi:hypothetical protein